jgi:hypothetical protein
MKEYRISKKNNLKPGSNVLTFSELNFCPDTGERFVEVYANYITQFLSAKLKSNYIHNDEEIQELSQ